MSKPRYKITNADIFKVFMASWFMQSAWNYERMQAQGYLHGLAPVLPKLYPKKEDLIKWMKIHLEFYNTEPHVHNFIVGMDLSLEEKGADPDTVRGIKSALMGPFAGLGDSLFWFTLVPIFFALGSSFGLQGSLIGPVLALALWIPITWAAKYYFTVLGYRYGTSLADVLKGEGLTTFREAVSAFGLSMVGALTATYVWGAHTPLVITVGTPPMSVKIQDMLNMIMPGLLSVVLVMFSYYLIKKGWSLGRIVLTLFVVGFILAYLGILG